MNVFEFVFDYLQFQVSSLIAGKRNYPEWKIKNYSMRHVPLTNKLLARELEIACKKKGILTYAEYLSIEQYGNHGYHAGHSYFGRTNTHNEWPKALLVLCKESKFKHVLEFGSGDGSLGVALIKQAKKEHIQLTWHGVEINKNLREQTKTDFKNEGLKQSLGKVVASSKDITIDEPSLVVFSYSLDSVPPEIFINTKNDRGVPDTIIGIRIKDNILTEFALTKEQLKQKGIVIENGIVRYKSVRYDLRSWKLYPWQRAYISLEALTLFRDVVEHCRKKSLFVVIDEFRPSPFIWEIHHCCIPKSLNKLQRESKSITAYYQQCGENLLYYPFYFEAFTTLLNSLGFSSINYDVEQKMARTLHGAPWMPLHKTYYTYAFVATKNQDIIPSTVIVAYPGRTIL